MPTSANATTNHNQTELLSLAPEMVTHIASYLSLEELKHFAEVSFQMDNLLHDYLFGLFYERVKKLDTVLPEEEDSKESYYDRLAKVFKRLHAQQIEEVDFLEQSLAQEEKNKERDTLLGIKCDNEWFDNVKKLIEMRKLPPTLAVLEERHQLLEEINFAKIKQEIEKNKDTFYGKCLHITRFPQAVFSHKAFQEYWCKVKTIFWNKRLKSLPEGIGQCKKLESFEATSGQLLFLLPDLKQCTNLKVLALADNQIKKIPEWIGDLENLIELYLHDNQLQTIPSEIGKLQELEILALDNNLIANLPSEIGNCRQLMSLTVTDNKLTSIPAELGNCEKLFPLSLSGNFLESIPRALTKKWGMPWQQNNTYKHDNDDVKEKKPKPKN